jgi:quercetin dioxygenase-like cupin family protein
VAGDVTAGTDSGRAGLVASGEARTLLLGPLGADLLAGAAETGGTVSFVVHPLAPRTLGSPVHTHTREDEWSYVLEGEVGVRLGDRTVTARPGDLVLKPRNVPHAFWNATDEPARILEVITPAGFEGYFARLGELLGGGGPPDLGGIAALATQYGMHVDPTSIPALMAEHDLRLP